MFHYYMFHKPYGCVTARKDDTFPTVMDYFKELNNPDLSPVGRLDRETEGLLFITDDGKWNQKMTHPDYRKEKVYEFIALGIMDSQKRKTLEDGVLLPGDDRLTKPCKIELHYVSTLLEAKQDLPPEVWEASKHNRMDHPAFYGRITITEGRKRQIRRMFKKVRCLIVYLKRISCDGIFLDEELKPGQWKEWNPSDSISEENIF
ncbi:MAG: pseudouridine synthase [Eubacteriales bacterium]|nr:pseudouridine synthase [Eubacteriales bacterium]